MDLKTIRQTNYCMVKLLEVTPSHSMGLSHVFSWSCQTLYSSWYMYEKIKKIFLNPRKPNIFFGPTNIMKKTMIWNQWHTYEGCILMSCFPQAMRNVDYSLDLIWLGQSLERSPPFLWYILVTCYIKRGKSPPLHKLTDQSTWGLLCRHLRRLLEPEYMVN